MRAPLACTGGRRVRALLAPLLLLAASGCSIAVRAAELDTLAQLTHPPLAEVSGIARSRTYDGVYWVHNDSGDEPRVFAVRADGAVIVPPYLAGDFAANGSPGTSNGDKPAWPGITVLGASNVDWEDIALDDGTLYIADMGNNGNARRDLGVYVVPEPNPAATERVRALQFLPVRYPEQSTYPAERWHFDCEALFVDGGHLYFLTKHRRAGAITGFERGTQLYRLDTRHTDKVNLLQRVATNDALMLPTAAALSPDGSTLAVLTYQRLWLFPRPASGDDWLAGAPRVYDLPVLRTGIAEGVTWDDAQTLVIASENRTLFRLPVAAARSAP
jgi:hypothetical protein